MSVDSTNEPISEVYLYAGPCDGMSLLGHDKTKAFKVTYSILIEDDESYVSAVHKPGQERQQTVYAESPEWTAFHGARTAVHCDFPGKPPREKAAA